MLFKNEILLTIYKKIIYFLGKRYGIFNLLPPEISKIYFKNYI